MSINYEQVCLDNQGGSVTQPPKKKAATQTDLSSNDFQQAQVFILHVDTLHAHMHSGTAHAIAAERPLGPLAPINYARVYV